MSSHVKLRVAKRRVRHVYRIRIRLSLRALSRSVAATVAPHLSDRDWDVASLHHSRQMMRAIRTPTEWHAEAGRLW